MKLKTTTRSTKHMYVNPYYTYQKYFTIEETESKEVIC